VPVSAAFGIRVYLLAEQAMFSAKGTDNLVTVGEY
jgi:hypothetical protein